MIDEIICEVTPSSQQKTSKYHDDVEVWLLFFMFIDCFDAYHFMRIKSKGSYTFQEKDVWNTTCNFRHLLIQCYTTSVSLLPYG